MTTHRRNGNENGGIGWGVLLALLVLLAAPGLVGGAAGQAAQLAPDATTGWGPPAVEGDDVFVSRWLADGSSILLALDAASGAERWALPIAGRVFAPPLLSGGTLYVGVDPSTVPVTATDGRARIPTLRALEPATGEERWRLEVEVGIDAAPIVAGDVVYLVAGADSLSFLPESETVALDAASGAAIWRTGYGAFACSSPVLADGVVLVRLSDPGPAADFGYLVALDAVTGVERWWVATPPACDGAPIAVVGDRVFVESTEGVLQGYTVAEGWESPDPVLDVPAAFGPVVVGQRVVVVDPPDAVVAVDPATGFEVWGAIRTPELVGPPLVVGEVLLLRSFSEIVALDAATGRERWRGAGGTEAPLVGDGALFIRGQPTGIVAIDAATGTERWSIAPGAIDLRPLAVTGGLLFAAPVGGDDRLRAIDPGTGTLLWATANAATEGPAAPAESAAAPASGAQDDPAATVPSPAATPSGFDESGETGHLKGDVGRTGRNPGPGPTGSPSVLWEAAAGGAVNSGPVVADGVVYTAEAGEVVALEAATGRERWQVAAGGGLSRTPFAVVEGLLYVVVEDAVVALDAASGEERWRAGIGDAPASTGPAVAAGFVVVQTDEQVLAIDAASGEERWANGLGSIDLNSGGLADPTIADGSVYIAAADVLAALDLATGETRWTLERGGNPSAVAVDDGVLYVADQAGGVAALAPADGVALWEEAMPSGVTGMAVGGGSVFVGLGTDDLVALDAATGAPRWQSTLGDGAFGEPSPTLVGDTLYVGSHGLLLALDAASGVERWRLVLGDQPLTSPAVVDGLIFIEVWGGPLWAVGGPEDGS